MISLVFGPEIEILEYLGGPEDNYRIRWIDGPKDGYFPDGTTERVIEGTWIAADGGMDEIKKAVEALRR